MNVWNTNALRGTARRYLTTIIIRPGESLSYSSNAVISGGRRRIQVQQQLLLEQSSSRTYNPHSPGRSFSSVTGGKDGTSLGEWSSSSSSSTSSPEDQVLDDAAAESRKIYDKTSLTSALHTALQRQALLSSSTFTATNPSTTTSNNPAPAWVHPPLSLTGGGAAAIVGLHQKVNDLEETVESLLQATKNTIPLAQLLLTLPPQDDRVRSLHRTFLSILSKCASALNERSASTTATVTTTTTTIATSTTLTPKRKNAMHVPVLDHPLLDKTLRLAVRARGDLGLPLHLPLYQTLAQNVAQLSSSSSYNYTSHNTTNWIIQLAHWAQEDFNLHHPHGSVFFFVSSPLCILAQRQRYGELAHLLTTILTSPNNLSRMNYVDEPTLQQLIRILYDDLYTHLWEEPPATTTTTTRNNHHNHKNKRKRPPPLLRNNSSSSSSNNNNNPHQMTMALQELLFVLEPSIWKLFGEVVSSSSSSSSIPPESSSLREAIDVLISTTTTTSLVPGQHQHASPEAAAAAAAAASLLSSKELLHALFPDEFSDDSQEFWEDDDDDLDQLEDEEDDEEDFFETNRHLTSGKWELHVDMDSDLSIVSITRHFADDDDDNDDNDDDDDAWSREVPPSVQWQRLETVPDIVQQIEVAAGQPLRYSKRLQRDLLHQFVEG